MVRLPSESGCLTAHITDTMALWVGATFLPAALLPTERCCSRRSVECQEVCNMTLGRPAYDSVLRRRARAVGRLTRAALTPSLYPSAPTVAAFWWDGHANFGDQLTPWLLQRYGRVAVHSSPGSAGMAGVGSILEQLPTEFEGTVWGSGLLYGRPIDLPRATFAAVRGHLTKQVLGIHGDPALGDPGILVSRHVERPKARWTLGVVPHGIHNADPVVARLAERYPQEVAVLDTAQPVDRMLRDIGRCEAVVSTSLHGLVIADSFGIPAAWFELEPSLWGADFKFRDYESVVTPGRSRRFTMSPHSTLSEIVAQARHADADSVSQSVETLESSLLEVASVDLPPFLAFRVRRPAARSCPSGKK
jgi:pyruvyltransferase